MLEASKRKLGGLHEGTTFEAAPLGVQAPGQCWQYLWLPFCKFRWHYYSWGVQQATAGTHSTGQSCGLQHISLDVTWTNRWFVPIPWKALGCDASPPKSAFALGLDPYSKPRPLLSRIPASVLATVRVRGFCRRRSTARRYQISMSPCSCFPLFSNPSSKPIVSDPFNLLFQC